jgi:hypothetical protein
VELVDILIIEEWNPNYRGGAWFGLRPFVGRVVEVEKHDIDRYLHYRWPDGFGTDTVVPMSCFVEVEENCLTIWNKKEI